MIVRAYAAIIFGIKQCGVGLQIHWVEGCQKLFDAFHQQRQSHWWFQT
jgi:hypothetical protein